MRAQEQYFFGTFHINVRQRLLLQSGRAVPLTPKAFDLLLILVENAGRVLSREELLRQLWPDTYVDQSNLSQHIFWIRKALGDSGEDSQFVETVPKLGYRFLAQVRREKPPELENKASGKSLGRHLGQRVPVRWMGASLLALIAAAGLVGHWWKPLPRMPRRGSSRIAVLPFLSLNHDGSQDYFSDGFTGEMITLLGRIEPERVRVIAFTTMMHYKNSTQSVQQIGRELGVDYVLEGGIQRDGDRVRINARLIQVKDQTEVWARSFNRDLGQVLTLQDEVARDIAEQIVPQVEGEPHIIARALAVNRAAYEDYLRGRYFWNERTVEGYKKAIDYFHKAIQEDPKYPQGYSGLADAYALLGSTPNPFMSRKYAMSQARAAALQALDLDETLAEAHTSLAFVKMHYEWDWAAAENEFHRAIALNPDYPTAHHWYAYYLTATGKPQAAVEQIKIAQQLDPLSPIINNDVGDILFYAGQMDAAVSQAKQALEINPGFPLAHFLLGRAYEREGQYKLAMDELRQAVEGSQGHAWAVCELAAVNARAGNKSRARELLKQVTIRRQDESAYCVAAVYAALDDRDQAFAWLDTAYSQRSGSLILLRVDPEIEDLRSDPRFGRLARRMSFPKAPRNDSLLQSASPNNSDSVRRAPILL
ncbi:MAG TPA: winged helix-turn-helix domain-containing protein, partial [Terriglobales bacterium]|nr:winged helix-turn-helix domain-containing protein [Terriglobales bacterium]